MNKYIKFLIAGLMIAAGVYLMMNRQIGWGIVVVFFSLSPILLFFKNEYILLAFWQMRKQNFVKAAHWLTYIKNYQISIWLFPLFTRSNFGARTSRKSRTIDEKSFRIWFKYEAR